MSSLPKPDPQTDADRLDAAADQAIAMADGDMRSAIRALLLAVDFLERQNQELSTYLSIGFVRGQLPPNNLLEDSLKTVSGGEKQNDGSDPK